VVQPVDPRRQNPSGAPWPVDGTDLDFRDGRSLAGVELDLPFGGCAPAADAAFGWVQVFTSTGFPGRDRVVAVEPTTCPPNALQTGTDLITLAPGATWSGH